jgi:SAM-dependent methyltransferase
MTTMNQKAAAMNPGRVSAGDLLNTRFYDRFPYPSMAQVLTCMVDEQYQRMITNQNMGDWSNTRLPVNPRIWIAGCGVNQPLITALRFPQSEIVASDLSAASLKKSQDAATNLRITNVTFREENIVSTDYRDTFDYVIATGVVHHLENPEGALRRLADALKASGVLELMVYNRFHRVANDALKAAVYLFQVGNNPMTRDFFLPFTKKLIASGGLGLSLEKYVRHFEHSDNASFADAFLQPIEHSFTLPGLCQLLHRCGLRLIAPHISDLDRHDDSASWNMRFQEDEIQSLYDQLPDETRWAISNNLLMDSSPLFWFYVERQDNNWRIREERKICADFLDTVFTRIQEQRQIYVLAAEGYRKMPKTVDFPIANRDQKYKEVVQCVDGATPMREIFRKLCIGYEFYQVNEIRRKLTTSAFPYLRAC